MMWLQYTYLIMIVLLSGCKAMDIYRRVVLNKTENSEEVLENKDMGPPDHLDAVKFERDGHMNVEFQQEIFLGEEKHHFRNESKEMQMKKLEDIFQRADVNGDGYMNEGELQKWIMLMVSEHMNKAVMESEEKFSYIDTDRSKDVTFPEFYEAFMNSLRMVNSSQNRKFTPEYVANRLSTIKKEWQKADMNDDNILNEKEFLFFQHPEMSNRTLTMAVEEFLEERDFDSNKKVDVNELVFGFPVGDDINVEDYMDGDELIKDKVYQFKKFLDLDADGFATIEELRVYLDPFSSMNARNDAHDMIFSVDFNGDEKLSLKEVKEASEYLTGTKLYDASSYLHAEL